MDRKATWTENYLRSLLGTSESVRLEFKESRILMPPADRPNELPKDKIANELTECVSAFANTEGGILIIGIAEKKVGKSRIAERIDGGVPRTLISPEELQRIIEGNLSPYLPGMHVVSVPLSEAADRCAFVIDVPKGVTAYQARDRRYYGRSEYENKALPDHVIRNLMVRNQMAEATLELASFACIERGQRGFYLDGEVSDESPIPTERTIERLSHLRAYSEYDKFKFSLQVRNTALITINVFKLVLQGEGEHAGLLTPLGDLWWLFPPERARQPRIFPYEAVGFPDREFDLYVPLGTGVAPGSMVLRWTIYLDNSPYSAGRIDLFDHLSAAYRHRTELEGGAGDER